MNILLRMEGLKIVYCVKIGMPNSVISQNVLMGIVGIINPRRACARVTVVACLSVCYRSSCFSVRLYLKPTILTGLCLDICVEFRKKIPFKSYGVKKPICK